MALTDIPTEQDWKEVCKNCGHLKIDHTPEATITYVKGQCVRVGCQCKQYEQKL